VATAEMRTRSESSASRVTCHTQGEGTAYLGSDILRLLALYVVGVDVVRVPSLQNDSRLWIRQRIAITILVPGSRWQVR
jgi:hypothetical protein